MQGKSILKKGCHLIQSKASILDVGSYVLNCLETFFIMLLFSKTRKGNVFHLHGDDMIWAVPSVTAMIKRYSCLHLIMNSKIHSSLMLMRSFVLHLNALKMTLISKLPSRNHHWWKWHFWQAWGLKLYLTKVHLWMASIKDHLQLLWEECIQRPLWSWWWWLCVILWYSWGCNAVTANGMLF